MLRDKMREIVEREDNDGDRFWLNDIGGPSISVGILYLGDEKPTFMEGCVGLVDEEFGGMIAYGPENHMRALAEKLNKLNNIEELMA